MINGAIDTRGLCISLSYWSIYYAVTLLNNTPSGLDLCVKKTFIVKYIITASQCNMKPTFVNKNTNR